MIVAWWADALRVVARDPVLQSVIESCRGEGLQETDDLMRSMVRAVCGQQVHNSAAKAAQSRVLAFAGNTAGAELARALVAADETALAALGLTKTKVKALRALAGGFMTGQLTPEALNPLTDAEILARLDDLPGVGPWTARMVMIFGLNRPDVFPVDDFGVKKRPKPFTGRLKRPGSSQKLGNPTGRPPRGFCGGAALKRPYSTDYIDPESPAFRQKRTDKPYVEESFP